MFVCVKLPEVELLDKVCKAVCSNFARVGGGGGEFGVFKKEGGGGTAASSVRRENWKTILKKNSLVIVRG